MKPLYDVLAPLEGMTYEELKPVAAEAGLPVDTLYKIVKGYTRRPSYNHVRLISQYLEARSTPSGPDLPRQ